jgi:hypothetical protein
MAQVTGGRRPRRGLPDAVAGSARRLARSVNRRGAAPTVLVTGSTQAAVAAAAAAVATSSWIKVRQAAEPPTASGERARGVGRGPVTPVAVVPAQDGDVADSLALSGTAVLLYGEPRRDRDDAVWPAVADAAAASPEATALAAQAELRDRVALRQRRDVLDRGAESPALGAVSIVCATNRPDELGNVLDNAARQRGVAVQLVLVTHGFTADAAALAAFRTDHPAVEVVPVEADRSLTLGSCLNLGIAAADGDDIVKMDDDNFYGPAFLLDLARDLRLSGAGLTGKRAHLVHLSASGALVLRFADAENSWAKMVQGGTMYFQGDLIRDLRFSDIPRAVDTDVLNRLNADGVGVYSSDRFNFVSVRAADPHSHTWKVTDATMLTPTGRLITFGDPRAHAEV